MAKYWTPPEVPVVRVGRDELNLTQFPIALLSDRTPQGVTILRFADGEKTWTLAGHPELGLPRSSDVEVYVCLMEIAREQGWVRTLFFSRYELLQRLGWSDSKERYERLRAAVARWVHVTITAENCFYDAQRRRRRREFSFHLLDASSLVLDAEAALEELSAAEIRRYQSIEETGSSGGGCWVRFSEPLMVNCRKGYVKALDVNLYLALRSNISQALYRYLDARRGDGKRFFRQRIASLAWDHLGLSANFTLPQVKRELTRAHEELLAVGYLSSVRWAMTKDQTAMVVYRFPAQKACVLPGSPADGGRSPASPLPVETTAQPELFGTWSEELKRDWQEHQARLAREKVSRSRGERVNG